MSPVQEFEEMIGLDDEHGADELCPYSFPYARRRIGGQSREMCYRIVDSIVYTEPSSRSQFEVLVFDKAICERNIL
jgi:hypothetical protein